MMDIEHLLQGRHTNATSFLQLKLFAQAQKHAGGFLLLGGGNPFELKQFGKSTIFFLQKFPFLRASNQDELKGLLL